LMYLVVNSISFLPIIFKRKRKERKRKEKKKGA